MIDKEFLLRPNKWITALYVFLGSLAVLFLCLAGYIYLFPNVFLGVSVGQRNLASLSYEQALSALNYYCEEITDTGVVTLKLNEFKFSRDFSQLCGKIDVESTAKLVYSYGRTGNIFRRSSDIINALISGKTMDFVYSDTDIHARTLEFLSTIPDQASKHWFETKDENLIIYRGHPGFNFDRSSANDKILSIFSTLDFTPITLECNVHMPDDSALEPNHIKEQTDKKPQNAYLDKKGKKIIGIVPHNPGLSVELSDIEKAISNTQDNIYTIPIKKIEPQITSEILEKSLFKNTLSDVTTKLNPSLKDRTENVRISAEFINGVMLNPGEEFSYNNIVGPRTYSRGFKDAIVFAKGEAIDGIGGGICQTSSTVYMAALYADFKITERRSHTFAVTYTPLGQDATVVYGQVDFRFVNDTAYPVKILAVQKSNMLNVKVLGTKTSNKTVTLITDVLEKIPFETIYQQTTALKSGKKRVKQHAYTGYKTVTYKNVTDNSITTQTKVNNSSYKKLDKIIEVGSGSSSPAISQIPVPFPTPVPNEDYTPPAPSDTVPPPLPCLDYRADDQTQTPPQEIEETSDPEYD